MLNSAAHKMKKKRNKCKLSAKLDAKEPKFGQILFLKPSRNQYCLLKKNWNNVNMAWPQIKPIQEKLYFESLKVNISGF